MHEMFRARTLFDLRPVHGRRSLWQEIDAAVAEHVDRDFLHVLANDCLASLPPLTFFQDAVVDSEGEHLSTFRLEHSALRPLVDVGRVFAMAAGKVPGPLDAGAICHGACAVAGAREDFSRSGGYLPRRAVAAGDASASARARPAPSSRRRCSAATTVTCSRQDSDRFSGCSNSPRIAPGSAACDRAGIPAALSCPLRADLGR